MKAKGLSIRKALTLSLLTVSLVLLFFLCSLWIVSEIHRSNQEIAEIGNNSIDIQKDDLQRRVVEIIKLIETLRDDSIMQSEEQLQSEILDWISKLRFQYGGYYFVNKPDGTALVFDGQKVTDNRNILNITDPNGLRFFDKEIEAYNNPDGGFMTYYFKRIDTQDPESKVSFMMGIKDWEWIIGAGNYIKDISESVSAIQKDLRRDLSEKILKILLAFFLFFTLVFLIAKYISNKANSIIETLRIFFLKLEKSNTPPTRKPIIIKEFEELSCQFSDLIIANKKNSSELEEALFQAQESSKLKTAFLNNMSHEIRTPLNAIVGFSNLLDDPSFDDQEKSSFIGMINNNSDRLLYMVDEILYLSKLESSKEILLNISAFDIIAALTEIRDSFKPQCINQKIGISLIFSGSDHPQMISTDRNKLMQVLGSLTSNALKFTRKGSIRIGYEPHDSDLMFYVEDTGIGITENKLDKIFEQFYQIDNGLDKQYSGAGLGLSISRRIIEFLGGKIWAKSEIGIGTTFYFTIPKNKQL